MAWHMWAPLPAGSSSMGRPIGTPQVFWTRNTCLPLKNALLGPKRFAKWSCLPHVLCSRTNIYLSMETSGDISVLWPTTFLWGWEVLNLLQSSPECTEGDLGFWSSKICDGSKCWDVTTCFYAFLDIPKSLETLMESFNILFIRLY